MDESDNDSPMVTDDAAGLKEMLGMFDVPAFARRGFDLEYALKRLHERLSRERAALLDMVRLRLRQWASAAIGPDDFRDVFHEPVKSLYQLSGADSPIWAARPALSRARRAIARDLIFSVSRFNRRWLLAIDRLNLDAINRQIEHYNRYYLLEKECVMGSTRLASRHFVPQAILSRERLLADYPTLPTPTING